MPVFEQALEVVQRVTNPRAREGGKDGCTGAVFVRLN